MGSLFCGPLWRLGEDREEGTKDLRELIDPGTSAPRGRQIPEITESDRKDSGS